MDSNEIENKPKIQVSLGWRLFGFLSKIDTQVISLIILILLSVQVLYGIIDRTPTQADLIAFYYGKTILIRFLGYLGIVVGLIDIYCRAFIHKLNALKWTLLKRPWNGLFSILMIWAIFAIGVAVDRNLAVFGSPYRYEGYLSYLAYAGIFICATLIKSDKYRKILYITVTASSTLLAILTMIKEMAGVSGLMFRNGQVYAYSATFINSNHYGYYLCVSMAVIVGLFMMVEKLHWKIVCGVCFAINLIVMIFNESLGPYLAIAVGLVLFFVFNWIRKGFKKTWPILILVVIFIVFSLLLNGHKMLNDIGLVANQTGNVIDVIGSGGSDTPEGQEVIDSIGSRRGVLWKNTIQVIKDHPVIGVGTDNIQLYINQIPHNEYLQVAANLGIPGILLYLAALICCFVYAIKNLKKISDGTFIAFMAALVYCASAFVGISIPVATFQLFFFLGLLAGWFKTRDDERMNNTLLEGLTSVKAS